MTEPEGRVSATGEDDGDQPIEWAISRRFLRHGIGIVIAGCVAYLGVLAALTSGQTFRAWLAVAYLGVAVVAGLLLRQGRARASVWMLGIGSWLVMTLSCAFLGGVAGAAVIMYPLIILLAGWMMGPGAATAVAAASIAVTFAFLAADWRGVLPMASPTPPLLRWLMEAVVYMLSAVLVVHSVRAYRERIVEARRLGEALAARNALIEAREADLNRAQAVAGVGSWVYDLVADRMQLSAETCRIFGVPPGTASSHDSYVSRVHPDDRAVLETAWRRARVDGAFFDSDHRILVGGRVAWVRQRAQFERDGDGAVLRAIGTTEDITESQAREAALQAARVELAATVDAIPDLLFEMDLEGRHLSFHAQRPELLVRSPDQLIGRTLAEVMPPAAARSAMAALREAHERGHSHGRTIELPMAAGPMWFELSVANKAVPPGQPPRLIVISRDITERKRTEDALRQREAELQGVLGASDDGIIAMDNDGRLVHANGRYIEMWGMPEEALRTRDESARLAHILPQLVDPETFMRHLRETRGASGTRSDRIELRDGRIFERHTSALLSGGVVIGRVRTFRDVTEHLRAERELRASEEKFAKAFRASPMYICICTLEEGRYIEVNEAFLRGMGRERGEIIGRTSVGIGFWDDPADRLRVVAALRAQGRVSAWRIKARRRDGAAMDCEMSGELIEFEDLECVLWVLNDVTDRMRVEAEVVELAASLERRVEARTAELQKANQELESFSYTISHDLRAPLRSMAGFSGLLTENLAGTLDAENLDLLRRIAASSNKMSRLIDGVLEYSRLARSDVARREVDLDAVLEEVASEAGERYPCTRLELHPLGHAHVDPVMIRQIFHNLVGNALKYSARAEHPVVEVGVHPAGAVVEYFVRDNGIGFDMAHAEHLFSLFTRLHTDPEVESTGAGLAIVKRLVERHGGGIRAEAAPGRGATFSFTLGAIHATASR
jgi:PAS domain S-box-containing protein